MIMNFIFLGRLGEPSLPKFIFSLFAALSAIGCTATPSPPAPPENVRNATPTPEEVQAAWIKASIPGPEHSLLQAIQGKFKAEVKVWPMPNKPPEVSTGTVKYTPILGGRFLREDFRGESGGAIFEGIGIMGYDRVAEQYVSYWIDSMNTAVSSSKGKFDPETRTLTWYGTREDPVTRAKLPVKSMMTLGSGKEHTFEMFDRGFEGEWVKSMEIRYRKIG
jgi:hypothetical protein